jgi:succinyl-CoA synthetase beta subunit
MDKLFKSEQAAIAFVDLFTPFAIRATKPSKTMFVNPFSSNNAHDIVVESIGKALYELQEKSKIATNKDL